MDGSASGTRPVALIGVSIIAVVTLIAGGVWASKTAPDPTPIYQAPITNSIVDPDGNLAMPMPRLATGFTLTSEDDGSTTVDFGVELGVYNTSASPVSPV